MAKPNANEFISEFDYALPWWRRIVTHSGAIVMFHITEIAAQRMVADSRKLLAALMASPVWPLIKTEQVIVDFTKALEEFEKEVPKI